jgi:phosphonate transport system substrate-binding protein
MYEGTYPMLAIRCWRDGKRHRGCTTTWRRASASWAPLRGALLATVVAAALLAGCGDDEAGGGSSDPSTLRVGLIPNVAPETQKAKYEPFGDYLEKALGKKVELFVATNYTGVVAALVADNLDLAYLGGLTYVQAREKTELIPLVTEIDEETGTEKYLSVIVTRTDSGVNAVKDLSGKDFAFGDPSSTSGSLYPRVMLTAAGMKCSSTTLDSCPPLRKVVFTGGHDAALAALESGQVAGAGVEKRILTRLTKDKTVDGSKIKVIASHEVQGYPWVAPASLDPKLRAEIVEAFENITDPELLDLLRAEAYTPVSAADYDEVEREARRLGLLAPR